MDFLSKLNKSLAEDTEILYVDYYQDKNLLEINIAGTKASQDIEKHIINEIDNVLLDLEICFVWTETSNRHEEIDKAYVDNFIQLIYSDFPLVEKMCEITFDYDNMVLRLKLPNTMIKDKLDKENLTSKLAKKFHEDCGQEIHIEMHVEDDFDLDEYIEKNMELENSLSSSKLKEEPVNLQARPYKTERKESFSIGRRIKADPIKIGDLGENIYHVTVEGTAYGISIKPIRNNTFIVNFYIHDDTGATTCKAFWSEELYRRFEKNIKNGDRLLVSGKFMMDSYANEYVINIESMVKSSKIENKDTAPNKRVELRCHTQMSNTEGFVKIEDLYKKLSYWGHTAIGITDLDVVQAFPNAMDMSKKYGVKSLYGLDATLVIDELPIFNNYRPTDSYVVFDIETTGLANQLDKITEIGAVKVKEGQVVDEYSSLVNPEKTISPKIIELTGITNEMVAEERTIDEVLPEFFTFCQGSALVAHNAEFDISNLRTNASKLDLEFDFPYVDTLYLARFLKPELRNHRLNTLAKEYSVSLVNHHRAVDDAQATAKIFIKMLEELNDKGLNLDESLNKEKTDWPKTATSSFNALILAKNQIGLKSLYEIISESHTNSLYKGPKIPIAFLQKHRDGLLIGSGNIDGALYKGIFNSLPYDEIKEIAKNYDFLEVQPRSNFEKMLDNNNIRTGIESMEYIDQVNNQIVQLGRELNIPVVATGDVYYLNKGDHIFREIVKSVKYNRPSNDSTKLYLKMTDEMLDEFSYLGQDKAYEIVVENTNMLADQIEDIRPIPEGKFAPEMEGAENQLREISYDKAQKIYGEDLPDIVRERLEVELDSIIGNGYAALYMIARKLVLKSNEDGYVVGSRGSVGSSFVATMTDITEVNPLPAHYICPNCKNSEFFVEENYDTGLDMEDKVCPLCGTMYKKDGHNIPFEVFLGFEGNKEPDIDLNFASEYQAQVHAYTEELFGKDYVYRAGTIGTIAENTAYGYIKKYYDERDMNVSQAEIAFLQNGIVGTKRTTGQHPGGIMIVPHENVIEDFTPINYPADDASSDVKTTHFAYRAIEETILKLDLLGHDAPSIIKRLKELTGVDPQQIDLGDKKTMKLFSSLEPLELKEEISENNVGTLGIPEFGTGFVRQMLNDTRPTSMGELFRISGLSHGTDVWLNNAQDLVRSGQAVLREVICTRDDIMTFLMQKGMDANDAFNVMERVRKGRGLTDEQIESMKGLDLPSWYIDSCQKIKYMFPKAHATAYVLMSFRIAYFKVHYPPAFYATYFTTKIKDFPGSIILKGLGAVKEEMSRIRDLGFKASNKENNTYTVLEVAEEMLARGYEFEEMKLGSCSADMFSVSEDGKLICPYCALEDISVQQSIDLYKACKSEAPLSVEDLIKKSCINKTATEALRQHGLLDGLQKTNQIDLFSIL